MHIYFEVYGYLQYFVEASLCLGNASNVVQALSSAVAVAVAVVVGASGGSLLLPLASFLPPWVVFGSMPFMSSAPGPAGGKVRCGIQ